MSNFGTATLSLDEKAGVRPLFRKPVTKLAEFWNRLKYNSFTALCNRLFFGSGPAVNSKIGRG
jgi:hypothetical protein